MQEELKGLVFKGQKDGINSATSNEVRLMVTRIYEIQNRLIGKVFHEGPLRSMDFFNQITVDLTFILQQTA